jgi:MFS family permease
MQFVAGRLGRHFHYAWVVVAVVFLASLAGAGTRAAPGVLIVPFEQAFGWTRAAISDPLSIGLFLFGLSGPFGAALMQRFGIRRTVLGAMMLIVVGVWLSLFMSEPWHLLMTWGLLVGMGTGAVAVVLGAMIANRWFVERRGLVLGIFTASIAAGQLIFLPLLAHLAELGGWQAVVWTVANAAALVIPLVLWLLPEWPRDIGVLPYGAKKGDEVEPALQETSNPFAIAFAALSRGMRSRDFWLLSGAFFVCGLSTNGLVGTHLISYCFDVGVTPVTSASLLAMMGVFNVIGTMAAGWASDRWDSRWLLFWFYGLRGVSLLFLPYSDFSFLHLTVFAAFYGLDWIATGPPTMRLITDSFGKQDAPILFGWIFVTHQIGAAFAASGAGWLRTSLDRYLEAFVIAGIACFVAALLVLWVGRARRDVAVRPAGATA